MKIKKLLFIILISSILSPLNVLSHPGKTDSNGCHVCKKNCESWGLSYGEYHCHNNNSSSNSNNNSNKNVTTTIPKSSDTTLKEVKINDSQITINDNMTYTTKNESISIDIITNDEKANVEYESNIDLNIGDNNVNIIVTAEDGSKKTYMINIKREIILSSNTNIKIIVNYETINFTEGKSNKTIQITSDKNSIDIEYTLEDKNAKADIINNNNLKVGNNKVIVRVTAENGDTKDYTILVNKSSESEDNANGIIGIGIISGIGYLIYKKRKSN